MTNLNNKVQEFRRQFNITKSFKDDQVFKLDPKGNLIAVWNNEDYYLTNKRNPTKFLSVSTMQHKLKYGVNFLRDLKLIEPKAKLEPKPKPKPEVPTLEEQPEAFKEFHKIPEDATLQVDLTLVDDKLSAKWRGKWVPLYSNKKPLANSTLQTKYGAKFLKDLSIPTVKQKPAELVQLPFNQFKYDKDFKSSLNEFFLDEQNDDSYSGASTELEELKTPIGNYLRSYQMIIPSRIKDPILLFKEVKSTFEKDVYKDIKDNQSQYDTRNYNNKHFLFSNENKKVLGKFKDELGGVPISEYVGLRPKMYSVITKEEEIRKAKGIKKNVVKDQITHENYLDCLFEGKTFKHQMNMLRSYNHQIYGINVNKTSLSPLDTKRWILDDGIHTLAFGHFKANYFKVEGGS